MKPLFSPDVIRNHLENAGAIPEDHINIILDYIKLVKNAKEADQYKKSSYNETSFKSSFIQNILIKILGYTPLSTGEYTLSEEQSISSYNEKITTKFADISLGFFSHDQTDNIIAPFELKGVRCKNLDTAIDGKYDSPVAQAWEYATNNTKTKWVLASNCQEIRLYHYATGKSAYEKFNINDLLENRDYHKFVLLLSEKNLLHGHTDYLLKETHDEGKKITDDFYRDYKNLRVHLIDHITQHNPDYVRNDIVEISQKILDRILFIAFAQSKNLIPKRYDQHIIDYNCTILNPYKPTTPLWDNFLGLFDAVNVGNTHLNIPAYNGGLFKYDARINHLKISDVTCLQFKTLAQYDFETKISVEILGHIFEQSIQDLEELKTDIHSTDFDKKKSKRKTDGVFYTPPFITHYIIKNTLQKWLEQKKQSLGFNNLPVLTDYHEQRMMSQKPLTKKELEHSDVTDADIVRDIQTHIDFWTAYKNIFANVKILDPACGSGAFLNAVFDFMLEHGNMISDKLRRLGVIDASYRWDTHILKHNLYGVDINNESVEITALSLWLKTVMHKEKLTYLGDNIKCGNSLIDDKNIAGDLAFDWHSEFADIMKNGGFDIVIGNPPYVFLRNNNMDKNFKEYYRETYKLYNFKPRTDVYFLERIFKLLSKDAFFGVIIPNNILTIGSLDIFRKHLLEKFSDINITNSRDKVFIDANVDTMILSGKNCDTNLCVTVNEINNQIIRNIGTAENSFFCKDGYIINYELLEFDTNIRLMDKIDQNSILLESIAKVSNGIVAYKLNNGIPPQTQSDIDNRVYHSPNPIDKSYIPYIGGSDIQRYKISKLNEYIKYGKNIAEPRESAPFDNQRLLVRVIPSAMPYCINAMFIDKNYINDQNYIIVFESNLDIKFLLAILNSRLVSYWFYYKFGKMQRGIFPQIKAGELKKFIIPKISPEAQAPFIEKCNIMLEQHEKLQNLNTCFMMTLESRLLLKKQTKILQKWYGLTYSEFIAELKKQKINIVLKSEREWQEYFIEQKNDALKIVRLIEQTDTDIDNMVYKIYGLNDAEIQIITATDA